MGKFARLGKAVVALVLVIIVGCVGYVLVEDMSLLDAVYMTVITLSTVGYREVQPLTPEGRLFTVLFILTGLGVMLYTVGAAAELAIEGEIARVLGRRRRVRELEKLSGHCIVCGYGRTGRNVVAEMVAAKARVVVVEQRPEKIELLEREGIPAILGDATQEDPLRSAGIERARALVAALSTDAENVYVTLVAKELNAKVEIIARAEEEGSERKLQRAGASRVINPYAIAGKRIAYSVLRPAVLEFLDIATHRGHLTLETREVFLAAGSVLEGKSLREAALRERTGVIVLAIKRAGGDMVFNPMPETRLTAGDVLVAMGETEALAAAEREGGVTR